MLLNQESNYHIKIENDYIRVLVIDYYDNWQSFIKERKKTDEVYQKDKTRLLN